MNREDRLTLAAQYARRRVRSDGMAVGQAARVAAEIYGLSKAAETVLRRELTEEGMKA